MGAPIHTTIQGMLAPNSVTSLKTKSLKALMISLVTWTKAEPLASCADALMDIALVAASAAANRNSLSTPLPRTCGPVRAAPGQLPF